MKQNLKKELSEFYHAVPPVPDSGRMTELMVQAERKTLVLPRESSLYWFIRTQIRFVNRKSLLVQFLLICLYGFLTTVVLRDNDAFLLLVPFAPIAVLLGTGELSRSFRCNMTELEFPSRFSLRQILLARLLITAVVDVLSLSCMLFLTAMRTYCTFGALILYGLVPSCLAAAGSLFLINRCRNGNVQYYVSAYCVGLSVLGAMSLNIWPEWYNGAASAVWGIVLAVCAAIFSEEAYRMCHDCLAGLKLQKDMEV